MSFCARTHIAVPSKPLNLSVLEVTSTTITIGWREPENLNGAIMGYRVFYINQNQTYFATIRSGTAVGELITYVLNDLSKFFRMIDEWESFVATNQPIIAI